MVQNAAARLLTRTGMQTGTHYTSPETTPLVTCQPSNRLKAAGSVNEPDLTGTVSHVLTRQVQVGQ